MTAPDPSQASEPTLKDTTVLIMACVAALLLIPFVAGMVAAGLDNEGPHSIAYYAFLAVGVLILAGLLWLIWKRRPALRLPASPRMRAARIMLYACLALSAIVGMGLSFAEGPMAPDLSTLTSAIAPLSPTSAVVLTLGLLLTTALSIRWHTLLDEHERLAYDFGAVAALYTYFIVSICWWLLARGGLAPPIDGFAIFWLVMLIWMIAWLVRRYL